MKKKFAIFFGCIALSLLLVGVWGYSTYFKPDPVVEEQLYEQFGEDFFNFEDVSLEDPVAADQIKEISEGQTSNSQPPNIQPAKPQPSDSAQPVNEEKTTQGNDGAQGKVTEPVTKPVTQEEINNKYKSQFERLQNVGLSRLDVLFSAAVEEYKEGKKTGTLKRSELIKKYMQAGTKLESSIDSQFYSALSQLESELKAQNLPTDIVREYEDFYENSKAEKRSEFLGKLK